MRFAFFLALRLGAAFFLAAFFFTAFRLGAAFFLAAFFLALRLGAAFFLATFFTAFRLGAAFFLAFFFAAIVRCHLLGFWILPLQRVEPTLDKKHSIKEELTSWESYSRASFFFSNRKKQKNVFFCMSFQKLIRFRKPIYFLSP